MPTISKIRFANVIYEQGDKRYHDELFQFDTHNGAILLENGGGKTVFIQAAMQAIIPHATVSERQIKDTLYLEEGPAHIAIEWLLNERPRQYVVTAVTLYTSKNKVKSLRYVYAYSESDKERIENIPFTNREAGIQYAASKNDMVSYYQSITEQSPMHARLFPQSIEAFTDYIEENYSIIREEWENMIVMNSTEGGIEKVFEKCKSTQELLDRLLIPSIEKADKHFNQLSMADQFEKQRSNLKKYKELSEKIIEYKAVEQQMERYVESFRMYHEAEKSYEEDKHYAAAYYHYLQQQKEYDEVEVQKLDQQLQQLQEEDSQLTKRKRALTIYKERAEHQEAMSQLAKDQQQLEKLSDELQSILQEKYSMEYALYRERRREAEETIQHAQQLLDKESEHVDIDDLQNAIELLKGQWLFLLEAEKEQIDKQLQEKSQQLLGINANLEQAKQQVDLLNNELDKSKSEVTKYDTLGHENKNKLQALKNELVAHENEQVAQLLKDFTARAHQLEHANREHEDHLKLLAKQLKQYEVRQKQLNDQIREFELQHTSLTERKQTFHDAEVRVKESLRTVLHQMSTTSTVYERAASYTNQLKEKTEQLQAQRAEKLMIERKATRNIDDYGLQTQFFADPYIESQITHWSQFSTIQTGIEYIHALGDAIQMDMISYSFWAVTLITTTDEQQALKDKIQVIANKLTTPIVVITREQARAFVQGEPFNESWIAPTFWQQNMATTHFVAWKNNAKEEARCIEDERIDLESKLSHTEHVQKTLADFLQQYPYERFKELTIQFERVEQALQREKYEHGKILQQVEETIAAIKQQKKLYANGKEELRNLQEIRIPKALAYVQETRLLERNEQQLKHYQVIVQQQSQKKKELDGTIVDFEARKSSILEERQGLRIDLERSIFEHPIYVEKDQFIARSTNLTAHMLASKIASHEKTINNVSESIQLLKERIQRSEQQIQDCKNALQRIVGECPTLDQQLLLPLRVEAQLEQLQQQQVTVKNDYEEQAKKTTSQEMHMNSLQGRIKLLEEQYEEMVPPQTVAIEELQKDLQNDSEQHQNSLHYKKNEHKRMRVQVQKLEKAENVMNEYYFQHQLNKILVVEKQLSTEQQTAFLYEHMKEIKRMHETLTQSKKATDLERQKIANEKKRFRDFCATLTDPKMRQVVVDGIENRNSYKEVTEHQQKLQITIQRSVHLAEEAIQGYDKDQQQIILYAVQQLVRVRHDLLEIPKKTRIRTETDTKYIYQFIIPEWGEQEAKEAIRNHIEWILNALEQDKFRDEYGNEDLAAVRKFLEKHLQTVPLLRQVLGNKVMQVKCRKVASDRQISSNYFNWEQSNKWSGGERWSKNMALYLGILKFIAEKSGNQSNTKRERTLMLDNPFGAASSDHVLSPIFYIAEQLGFQIIALTAHAEGKFIGDYFPVVYSCRLSYVHDESHQVVQKEQQLNKAYFADQQPEALQYVGEKKQLSLFDSD